MRLIERLYDFLEHKQLTPYAFERTCEISNGYLNKQHKGGGSVGSDILEKIHQSYPDLSLIWLITGKGKMIFSSEEDEQNTGEGGIGYTDAAEETIEFLKDKIRLLELSNADKDKIIQLLEKQIERKQKEK